MKAAVKARRVKNQECIYIFFLFLFFNYLACEGAACEEAGVLLLVQHSHGLRHVHGDVLFELAHMKKKEKTTVARAQGTEGDILSRMQDYLVPMHVPAARARPCACILLLI